ncbi:11015_t:CDS:1, partial [Funneliformis mosseae]
PEIEWHSSIKESFTPDPEELWFEEQLYQQFANEPLITAVGYQSPKEELEDIYREFIKIKQVIAKQPITKRGSQ